METQDLFSLCAWPPLPEKYERALQAAVHFILERFCPVGIVAAGTIIRGNPDPSSDLDLYVIHRQPFRQRVQKFFNGVPAEIFVNPPASIESYLVGEHEDGVPHTAHMLATGFVVLSTDPVVEQLRDRSRQQLTQPPSYDPLALRASRYSAATLFEDALDVAERDAATAQMLATQAVAEMLLSVFRSRGVLIPRSKELLSAVTVLDAETGELAQAFFTQPGLSVRLDLAGRIADRTIGTRGFFEWEGPVDPR